MKIAVFYENIHDMALDAGMKMDVAMAMLRDEGMELLYMKPESWIRDRYELSMAMEKLGLDIEGMHFYCDFAAEPDTERYKDAIDAAAEAGAGNILVIPGMYTSDNPVRDLENMINGMQRAVDYGQRKKIQVLMEDYDGKTAPYNSITGLQYFMDRVEGLGCAFDTGNFVMFHENELEAYDQFADRIRTVHLKDRCAVKRHDGDVPFHCADGSPIYACTIGSGNIQIAEILNKLRRHDYPGNVIVELYACDPKYMLNDAIDSIRWVKEHI